jgi:hypothetical protein
MMAFSGAMTKLILSVGVQEIQVIHGRCRNALNETGYMHNRVRMVVASFLQAFINRVAVGREHILLKNWIEMSANVGIGNGQQVPVVMQLLF